MTRIHNWRFIFNFDSCQIFVCLLSAESFSFCSRRWDCRVHRVTQLFLWQVSWIRRKDYHLLTVGLTTYTGDGRYLVEHVRHLQNWGLQIKFVQPRDAGLYECQVSTHPPTSIFIELKVIGRFKKNKNKTAHKNRFISKINFQRLILFYNTKLSRTLLVSWR